MRPREGQSQASNDLRVLKSGNCAQLGPKAGSSLSQGSAEAVRDAVQALSSETIGVKVVAMGVGPISAGDVMQAQAMGAGIIAFNVKTAGADVDSAIKQNNVSMMSHRVIYSLLDEVGSRAYPHSYRPRLEAIAYGCS